MGDAGDDDDEDDDEGGDAELAEAAAAKRRLLAAKVSAKGLGLRRGLARSLEADENEGQEGEEIDPKVMKKIEKKRRVAYQELKERGASRRASEAHGPGDGVSEGRCRTLGGTSAS